MNTTKERCFACGRVLGKNPTRVDTRDDQTVFVGSECAKHVLAAGAEGWQPMDKGRKSGPRLYPLPSGTFKDWAGEQIAYRIVSGDEPSEVVCEVNPHGDAWHPMGRHRSVEKALELAAAGWNAYDKQ